MVAMGAIAASGAISLTAVLILAFIGAVLGDGGSYLLGRHYHEGIKKFWPFSKHPKLIERGTEFFHRHGGKSVLLGRFVGPVRAIVPLVVGMMNMSILHFFIFDILAGIGWAVVHIIPGFLIGGSLIVLGAISFRLILVIIIVLVLAFIAFWIVKKAFYWFERQSKKREKVIFLFTFLFLIAFWIFLGLAVSIEALNPLVKGDEALFHFFQSLRTPWGDRVFIIITELGDYNVNLIIEIAVLVVLLFYKKFRTAGLWAIAMGGCMLSLPFLKWIFQRVRPIDISHGVLNWSFPSAHAAMSAALYGFLAVILMRTFAPRLRWLPFSIAICIAFIMGFSRLYLGVHWFSDVLAGFALGWAWVMLVGIFYFRYYEGKIPRNALLLTVGAALLLAGSWNIYHRYTEDLVRYQQRPSFFTLTLENWWNGEWKKLPVWLIDLRGKKEEPLTFQFAGDPEKLAALLTQKGWKRTISIDYKRFLNLLIPKAEIQELPLLPKLENGHQERLLLSKIEKDRRIVFRLWPTTFRLSHRDQMVWVGTIESERAFYLDDMLTVPKSAGNYTEDLKMFALDLPIKKKFVQRSEEGIEWDGMVLIAEDVNYEEIK